MFGHSESESSPKADPLNAAPLRRSLRFQSKVQSGKESDTRKQSMTDELRSETKKPSLPKPSVKGSEASVGMRGPKHADLFNKSGNNQLLFSDWLEYESQTKNLNEEDGHPEQHPSTKVCFILKNQDSEYEEDDDQDDESNLQNLNQRPKRVSKKTNYHDEMLMKLYNNPNARTPKKKKKRNDKFDREAEENDLVSAMLKAAKKVELDAPEDGVSRTFDDESGSQLGYSRFLKNKIMSYTRRKNIYEDVDLISESKLNDKGELSIYCRNDSDTADLQYDLVDPRLGKRDLTIDESYEKALGEAYTRSTSGDASPSSGWLKSVHANIDKFLAEVKPTLFTRPKSN